MNKIKMLLTTFVLLLCGTTVNAYDFEANGLYYAVNSEKEKTVAVTWNPLDPTGYIGTLTIPESVEHNGKTYSVTIIGWKAFRDCTNLTEINLPQTITEIGEDAFHNTGWWNNQPDGPIYIGDYFLKYKGGCPTNIELKDGTKVIADGALGYCNHITNVRFPESLITIGSESFIGCAGLTQIEFPSSLTTIGIMAFRECTGLTKINIPNSVKWIWEDAFFDCSNLTDINIPNDIRVISGSSFGNTPWMNSQPDGLVYAGDCLLCYKGDAPTGVLNIKEGTRIIANQAVWGSNISSVNIPNSVEIIGTHAFSTCRKLSSIIIPKSVKHIDLGAFSNTGLTSIIVEEENPVYDSRENCNAIIDTETNTLIAGCGKTFIPNSVTTIGDWAFYNCGKLYNLTIPNSVKYIGRDAFWGCTHCRELAVASVLPPTASNEAFTNLYKQTILKVPVGSLAAYQTDEVWSKFQNIQESPALTIDTPIRNTTNNTAPIYNLQGVQMKVGKEGIPTGIYLQGGKKMIIR